MLARPLLALPTLPPPTLAMPRLMAVGPPASAGMPAAAVMAAAGAPLANQAGKPARFCSGLLNGDSAEAIADAPAW
ncbi:Uncharacterised protein [Mycobacterium tuberculosis]|uniref:Uncharacterized protein n=2 Tax=Mycobacterium tuberculosis TaxID=1773 RepID=A0A0T9FNR0_MYCTX|nr:hypothetical protein FF22_03487 [Mycobacterium tuberculosis]KPU48738.1 hypothetical protein AFM15_03967 [Mycobacterium tuberculosis]OMH55611.1 hypothetical protein A4U65_01848 [Mycobacterium tuberculosis]OMH59675.1 hypothetical protein A4S10_01846 [Mycobacterium tuberculosis]CEZ26183.1 Uncharacterised protein [Mycobacterium tuberculosis]